MLTGISIVNTKWIFWSLNLFGLMGVIFVLKVLPLQSKIEKFLKEMLINNKFDKILYHQYSRRWNWYAYFSFIVLTIILILMVVRPL